MLEFSSVAELRAHYAAVRQRLWSAVPLVRPEPPAPPKPPPPKYIGPPRRPVPARIPTPRERVEAIVATAARFYGVPLAMLRDARNFRKRPVVRARWAAIVLLRRLTTLSLPQIGRIVGTDHGTAINALARMSERAAADACLKAELDCLAATFARPEAEP